MAETTVHYTAEKLIRFENGKNEARFKFIIFACFSTCYIFYDSLGTDKLADVQN